MNNEDEKKTKVSKKTKVNKNTKSTKGKKTTNNSKKKIEEKIVNDNKDNTYENTPKKTSFNLVEVIIIMVITTVFGLLLGGFIVYVKFDSTFVNSATRKSMTDFVNVYDGLTGDFYGIVDEESLMSEATKALVKKVGDPYTTYLDKEEYEEYKDNVEGTFIGLGVEITYLLEDGPTIVNVFSDSKASEAGLLAGDVIVKVQDKTLKGLSTKDVSSLIGGHKKGEKIKLTVLRDNNEKEFVVEVGDVQVESVDVYYADSNDKKAAIITINNFAKNTYSQFREAYQNATKEGADGLVIDLRGNNSTYFESAYQIASLFLDKGSLVYQTNCKGKIEKFFANDKKEVNLPVVILVNNATTSAGELFAVSLKENIDAKIVGVRTGGNGIVQKTIELSTGAAVMYPIGSFSSPSEKQIVGYGIVPDFGVSLSDEYYKNPTLENDNQLKEAVDILTREEVSNE